MAGKARNSHLRAAGLAAQSSYLHPVSKFRHTLFARAFGLFLAVGFVAAVQGQFYSGSQQEYGKNRVQYQEFLWQQYRFQNMEVFFYKEGRDIARYTAQAATLHLKDLEKQFDFALDERLQFIVYNSLTDFRQSNIGIAGVDGQQNIGDSHASWVPRSSCTMKGIMPCLIDRSVPASHT